MGKIAITPTTAINLIQSGPTVLVTCADHVRPNIITVAWHTPVCWSPPTVAISVMTERHSYGLIAKTREYAINIPGAGLLDVVHACGNVSGRDQDKFHEFGLTPVPARAISSPLIGECIGHLECKVVRTCQVASHALFVGEVVAASVIEEFFDGWWVLGDGRAQTIHYLGGSRYGVLKSVTDAEIDSIATTLKG